MKTFPAIFIVALATLVAVGAGLLSQRTQSSVAGWTTSTADLSERTLFFRPSGVTVTAEDISAAATPPKGFVEYRNTRYGFSFYHSEKGVAAEYDEGGGAMTIVLENTANVRGLQIFIVPYGDDIISEERFQADVPSGVRENVELTTVGLKKIPAVTFTSFDQTLGETREVWFLHGGYLYEITTFKGVGDWFSPIIQSWRFLK